MGSIRMIVAQAVVLSLLLSPPVGRAQDQSKSADADSMAINQVFADFFGSFSRQDAHATAMTFAEDGDFTNMFGTHIHGRNEIEQRFVTLFRTSLKTAQRTDTLRSIRFYTPEVAFADADTVITGTKAADGSDIPFRKGLMIVVMTKENGRWLINNFHEAEYPANRTAPVIAPAKHE